MVVARLLEWLCPQGFLECLQRREWAKGHPPRPRRSLVQEIQPREQSKRTPDFGSTLTHGKIGHL
jgi:hypothetical protein